MRSRPRHVLGVIAVVVALSAPVVLIAPPAGAFVPPYALKAPAIRATTKGVPHFNVVRGACTPHAKLIPFRRRVPVTLPGTVSVEVVRLEGHLDANGDMDVELEVDGDTLDTWNYTAGAANACVNVAIDFEVGAVAGVFLASDRVFGRNDDDGGGGEAYAVITTGPDAAKYRQSRVKVGVVFDTTIYPEILPK